MSKIKVFRIGLVLLIVSAVIMAGCSSKESQPSSSAPASSIAPAEAGASDAPPAVDNSKKISIELLEMGWVNTPMDGKDPFKQWIDEKYNIDFKLTNVVGADLESRLLTRFASNEPPDLIFLTGKDQALKLYNQGVLLEDWTPLLDKVPTVAQSTSDLAKTYVTQDGKMFALPKQPEPNTWSMKIRADWMKKLNLSMPQTDEQLFDILHKFTFDDPDGDGKPNTYGITTAGSGSSLAPIGYLETMYGQPGFLVTDNKADHAILNGTHQKYLDFMKRLVDAKVIDPDWYTQSWAQQGTKLFTDKIGMIQYPSAILSEYEANTNNTGAAADIWENLPIPKGADNGGKNVPGTLISGMYVISAKAAKDPEKLERILQIIEGNSYPNEGYWALRWGMGITGEQMFDMDGGAKYFKEEKNDKESYRVAVPGAWDYGTWIATGNDKVLQGSADAPGKVQEKGVQLDQETIQQPVYPDFQSLLNLDPQLLSDVSTLQSQFDIKYILGEVKDYETFKTKWLSSGGQQLLDSATEQYKKLGDIK
jgi:putative aldouronate transport system substrate-binding protein